MIDEKKVAEFQAAVQASRLTGGEVKIEFNLVDAVDTLEKLWRVARCAEVLISQLGFPPDPIVDLAIVGNLRNALSALREREGRG